MNHEWSDVQSVAPYVEPKHSGLGIASFVLSVLGEVVMLLLFVLATAMKMSNPDGFNEKSTEAILVGFFILGAILLNLLALGFGVAGLTQTDRKKVFAIVGVILSGITVAGTIAMIVIGNLIK